MKNVTVDLEIFFEWLKFKLKILLKTFQITFNSIFLNVCFCWRLHHNIYILLQFCKVGLRSTDSHIQASEMNLKSFKQQGNGIY